MSQPHVEFEATPALKWPVVLENGYVLWWPRDQRKLQAETTVAVWVVWILAGTWVGIRKQRLYNSLV